jgi:hypothetical protein
MEVLSRVDRRKEIAGISTHHSHNSHQENASNIAGRKTSIRRKLAGLPVLCDRSWLPAKAIKKIATFV